MTFDCFDLSAGRVSRRSLLRGAVAGAAVAALPATVKAGIPEDYAGIAPLDAALGRWQGGQGLATTAAVRAGWLSPCASATAACAAEIDDHLVDADATGAAGSYRVRVLGLGAAAALGSLRVEAQYGESSHRLWQTWSEGGQLQTSAPTSARWNSESGEGLALRLRSADAARTLVLPARQGVYVALLSADGSVPGWRRVALRALDAERPLTLSLVDRRSGAVSAVPHLLLAVERSSA